MAEDTRTQAPLITDEDVEAHRRELAARGIRVTYANMAEVEALAEHLRKEDRTDHCGLVVEGADGPTLDATAVARIALEWLTIPGGVLDGRRARWVAEALEELAGDFGEPAAVTTGMLRALAAEYRDGKR